MQDILTMLHNMKRPRLMMRAARIGAEDYRRAAHLPRLLGYGTLPRHGKALMQLMTIEGELEDQRKMADPAYSLIRHMDVMIALVAEARIFRASQSPVGDPT